MPTTGRTAETPHKVTSKMSAVVGRKRKWPALLCEDVSGTGWAQRAVHIDAGSDRYTLLV